MNNLESKHSLLMKFGQFMPYYKRKNVMKKFHKYCDLRTSSRSICACKRIKPNLYQKMKLLQQATYIRYVLAKLSKFVQISTQTLSDSFLEDSLKIKKGLELVFRSYFSQKFLRKEVFCNVTSTGQISSPDFVYFPSYSLKCFMFHAQTFDDVMTFVHLKCQNLIISRTKKSFRSEISTRFNSTLFST